MAERYTAENLTFTRSGRPRTDNVSLSLSQGELATLIGPHGA
ncbi:hemin ABC transporter ATP-binding subunit, partial [Enterobacter hormaechei]